MKNACLFAVVFGLVVCVFGIQFDEQQQQLQTRENDYSNYYDESAVETSRTHHKHKLKKKLKKRLLLQCLLEHRRRRRDTDGSGRFLLPVVLQSTNVNVGNGQSGYGGEPQYGSVGGGEPQYGSVGGGGCTQMLNNHGPLHGSLGSLQGLLGSTQNQDSSADDTSGSRNGMYYDWNRYARQFHRSFVRPLVRLF